MVSKIPITLEGAIDGMVDGTGEGFEVGFFVGSGECFTDGASVG